MFVYGTQFHRPPNPPPHSRVAALEQIAGPLGFNTIKVWTMWNWCNPRSEVYDFEELDEIMATCDRLGLRVIVNTILETAPYWLAEQYPDARYVNADLEPLNLRGRSSDPNGGWPGLCLDHAAVRQAAARFLTALANHVKHRPSLLGYDCWNEPHVEPAWFNSMWPTPNQMLFCYCETTTAEFRFWLSQKYGTIASLNEAWIRRFRSWDDVLPPQTHGTYADWLDWRRFMIDSMSEQMAFRVKTLQAADPDHFIMSHGAKFPPIDPLTLSSINNVSLAQPLDRWGCAIFPKWHRMTPALMAAKFDACRSDARGKPWWLAELQGGHGMTTGLQRSAHVQPSDIRLWNWLALVAGASAIVYWTYMAEATGTEATGFGLVNAAQDLTPRAREAARICSLLQRHEALIESYKPSPQVGILYDPDNQILSFAMEGKEDPVTGSAQGYYRAAWQSDVLARFLQPDEIRELGPAIRVLLVPWHLIGKPETAAALNDYVRQGGVLICDTALGLFDEHGRQQSRTPANLHEAWGIVEEEAYWVADDGRPATIWERMGPLSTPPGAYTVPPDPVSTSPYLEVTDPVDGTIRGRNLITPLKVSAPAEVVGTCQAMPVAARSSVGKGSIYYFGTNLGATIHEGDEAALRLVGTIIRQHTMPHVMGSRLRPRLIEGEGEALLVVFNDQSEIVCETLQLPPVYRLARDVDSESPQSLDCHQIEVEVNPFDARVIHLHTELNNAGWGSESA